MSDELNQQLYEASMHGYLDEVERLIVAGADPNAFATTTGDTPLKTASYFGHVAVMAALIKAGALLDVADSTGATAIMAPAYWGVHAAVKVLIDAGADVNHADTDGDSVLHWTAKNGQLESSRMLLEAGASTAARNKHGECPVDVVRDSCGLLDRHTLHADACCCTERRCARP